jgi:hypothetical protein
MARRRKQNNRKQIPKKFDLHPSYKKMKKAGFVINNKGNLQIPTTKKKLKALHNYLKDNPDVIPAIQSQRKGQLAAGAPAIDGFVVDELELIEAKTGLDALQVVDILDGGESPGMVNTIDIKLPLYKRTLRTMAGAMIGNAINRNITSTFEIVTTSQGDFSKGELAFMFFLYDLYSWARGDDPNLNQALAVWYRWCALLIPRVYDMFAFDWSNVHVEFDTFFNQSDFDPGVVNCYTVGRLDTTGTFNIARKSYTGVNIDEDFILEWGKPAAMDLMTQFSEKYNETLVDVYSDIPERNIPHAWAVPTGFGDEETSFRFYSTIRHCVNLNKFPDRYWPYACTGFVDSTDLDLEESVWPARGIEFSTAQHFAYQVNKTLEYNARRAQPWLVYPKLVFISQILRRILACMIDADIKVTETEVKRKASAEIKQHEDSVFFNMGNKTLAKYICAILSNQFFDSWTGFCSLPDGVCVLAGSTFVPAPQFKASALPFDIQENLEMLGTSLKEVVDDWGRRKVRVTIPTLVCDGSFNMTGEGTNALQDTLAVMYGIDSGNITYGFGSGETNGLVETAVPPIGYADYYECVTTGIDLTPLSLVYSVNFNALQPALRLTIASATHDNYNYDSYTRIISRNQNDNVSRYDIFKMKTDLTSCPNKFYYGPHLLEICPVFLATPTVADYNHTLNAISATASVFGQMNRVPYFESFNLEEDINLVTLDRTFSAMAVGSKYQPARTALAEINQMRLVEGDGSWWLWIKPGLEGISTVASVGADLLDYFGKNKVADVFRKGSKIARDVADYIPGSLGVVYTNQLHLNRLRVTRKLKASECSNDTPSSDYTSDVCTPFINVS